MEMTQDEPEKSKKKILIFCDYYLPGYKSGGGMRTIVNMVDRLKDRFHFYIITRDHDGKLDREQYSNVKINQWNSLRGAQVFYITKDNLKISKIQTVMSEVKPDLIYSNSYFATFTVYLLLLKKLKATPNVNVILAPCGELSEGALQLNARKKNVYLKTAKLFDLNRNVIWKASSELEKKEIEPIKGSGSQIFIAPDMLPQAIFENYKPSLKPLKKRGEAKMVFLSRFMKKKNFRWLLENLNGIRGKLEIDIYGPLEDAEYWEKCQEIIRQLPENIKVNSKGSVPHEQVLPTLAQYHFFIMPTLGENFGHIFLEALAAGCPLLISDNTPWLDLERKGIGWDLSLESEQKWIEKINHCINLDQAAYSLLSDNARQFAIEFVNNKNSEENTLSILKIGLARKLTKDI